MLFPRQKSGRPLALGICLSLLLALAAPAGATEHLLRVPLHDGKLRTSELADGFARELNLPSVPLAQPPGQWPTWPDWLTCGGAEATQNARARRSLADTPARACRCAPRRPVHPPRVRCGRCQYR